MYKKMDVREKARFNRLFDDMVQTAKFIDENLINKTVYYESVDLVHCLKFEKNNFMHLCGIKYEDKGAGSFFDACISGNVNLNLVEIKNDGTTFLKLNVIKSLQYLLSNSLALCDSGLIGNIHYDAAIKTRREILYLGMKKINTIDLGEKYYLYAPQTLQDTKKMRYSPKGEKVIAIKVFDEENELVSEMKF